MKNSLDNLIPVVREAGALLRERFESIRGSGEAGTFKAEREMVLGVDLESQKVIVAGLERFFPGYGIYSEELPNWSEFESDRRMKFAVDPLDGTHNYHFGIPLWGITVGLVDAANRPLAGLIYLPMSDLLLIGDGESPTQVYSKGREFPARASGQDHLKSALVAYDNQFYRLDSSAFETYRRLTRGVFTTRITGSAAFDTAMVALGRFDARVFNGVEAYDIAGGVPIVRGSGGVVCGFDGSEDISLFERRLMVCGSRRFAAGLSALVVESGLLTEVG